MRIPTLLSWVICLAPVSATAVEQPDTLITIAAAIDIAQQSNLALRRSRAQVELARINVDGSRAAFYPSVSAQVSSAGRVHGSSSTATTDQMTGTASASIGSSVNLFKGFADQSALESDELLLAAGEDDLERQRQLAVFETISAYLEVVAWQEYVEVSRQYLEAQARSLEQIQEYQHAGKRPIADVYQQQADVAAAELRLLTAERDHRVGKLQLLRALGRSPEETTVEVAPIDVDSIIAELTDEAGYGPSTRPDLLAQRHRIDAAAEQIDVAWAGYLPSLGLYLEAGSAYDSDYGPFVEQTTGDRLGVTLGLTLSMPLFDAEISTRVEHAEVEQSHARLVLEELEQQAQVEIRQAEMDFNTVHEQLEVAASRLASAAQSLAAQEERYRVGATTLVELSLMRAQNLEATYDNVKTKYDLLLSAVAVRYQRGDLAGMVSLFAHGGAS